MPKSRTRHRRFSPLTRAKNAVRGSQDPYAALAKTIGEASLENQIQLLGWAETVRFGKRAPAAEAFPDRLPDIRQLTSQDKGSYLDDVKLLTTRLLVHKSQVISFVRCRFAMESALLRSNYSQCNALLEGIESELKQSMWLLQMKVAIIALRTGLEAQKRFSGELISTRGKSTVSSVLRFTSQRNEESTSASRYLLRVKEILGRDGLQESTKTYYNFHLTYQVPEGEKEQRWLLLHASQTSLIDAYESFVSSVLVSARTDLRWRQPDLLAALDAAAEVGDLRIAKLRFLAGRSDDQLLKSRNLDPDSALLRGAKLAISSEARDDLDDPRCLWIQSLGKMTAYNRLEGPAVIADEWVSDLRTAATSVDQANDAVNAILKRSLNTDVTVTNTCYVSWAIDAFSKDAPFDCRLHLNASLCSFYLDPWDLPFLDEETKPRYLAALNKRYGQHIVVRFAAWMAGLGEEPPASEVASEFKCLAKVFRAYQASDFEGVIRWSAELCGSQLLETFGVRWECNAYLKLGKDRDAVRFAGDRLSESPATYGILPVEKLVEDKKWKELRPFGNEIGLAIILDLFFRRTGKSEISSFRRYAIEDFLRSRGFRKPSELGSVPANIKKETLIYFFSEVCIPEVMDLMTAFPSSRSVQEERRAICSILSEIAPENATKYREEITRITAILMRDEGVRIVDQSRVFVDKEGFIRWADRELKESFDRYRSLFNAQVGFDEKEFLVALREFLEKQQPIPEHFLGAPKGEADALLLRLISDARDNFLLSPTHGLDAFLSMRVRHGTLSGMLRGPLEQNRIISQRGSGGGRYQRDGYWTGALTDISKTEGDAVDLAIMKFSERFDAAIDSLRERLQIRRKDRPLGMFEIPVTSLYVHILRSRISAEVRLEDFIQTCIELFWLALGDSLRLVQRYISTTFRENIGTIFESLETELQLAMPSSRRTRLNQAVTEARGQLQAVMDSIRGWFEGTQAGKRAYPIGQAIEVALDVVRIAYRNFKPDVSIEIDAKELLMIDSVTAIGDIIFTALDNVYKHSGIAICPKVSINVTIRNEFSIALAIESETAAGIDLLASESRLCEVRDRIRRGEYKTMAVSGEGGTGLMKLKLLVDPSGTADEALTFGFTSSRTFEVVAILPTYGGNNEDLAR